MNADEGEGEGGGDRQVRECRFCFEEKLDEGDKWLAPCLCAGTMKWVHRSCLNKWIEQVPTEEEKQRCPTCLYTYLLEKRLRPLREWSLPWRVILIKPPVAYKTLEKIFYRGCVVGDFLLYQRGIADGWGLWWYVTQLFSAGVQHILKYTLLIFLWSLLASFASAVASLLTNQLLLVPLFKWSAYWKCITEAVCSWEIADSTTLDV